MKNLHEIMNETTGINKKLFGQYADEILANTIKEFKIKSGDVEKQMRQLQNHINNTFQNMSQDKSNPNRIKYKKFLPKTYDDGMFTNDGGNAYESQFWQMKDAERDTITKNAVKRYLKHNAK